MLVRLLILAQVSVIMMGRKTPEITGTKIKTAWSQDDTIIVVLLFLTVSRDSTVGTEKKLSLKVQF